MIRCLITFDSESEKKQVERLAQRAKLSFSNYVRSRLDLEPLARGGAREGAGRPTKESSKQRKAKRQTKESNVN